MNLSVSGQFMTILEKKKINDLKPFLQTLDKPQKKELAATLKKINKEYLQYRQVQKGINTFTFTTKANDVQKEIIWIAGFVVCSLSDFERLENFVQILDSKTLEKVIDWHCPDWFSELVNRLANDNFLVYGVNYGWIMDLTERGYLHPSKELVVMAMPQLLFDRHGSSAYYTPVRLLERAITLAEHIWWLFEFQSNIHWVDENPQAKSDLPPEQRSWTATLKRFSAEGKIDRQRLLRSALQAANRNFDKNASGWFIDLFTALEPGSNELLGLQQELIGVLSSPHPKPVGSALRFLKEIVDDKDFQPADLLGQAPVLLSSETKNIVTTTLAVMEKLARKDTKNSPVICQLAAHAFIHMDEQLQTRAAKLIDKYRTVLDDGFPEILQPYETNLLSTPRSLLGDLLQTGRTKPQDESPITITQETHKEIPPVTTIDDIVFLASQAFDNNQPWHIELLPAVLVESVHLLTGRQIAMLEPALQRALKLEKGGIQSTQGLLDMILARFFIDVCTILIRREPENTAGMQQMISQSGWDIVGGHTTFIQKRTDLDKLSLMHTHGHLLLIALGKMKRNDRLPMISTPTHEPGYIDPAILISRLASYQQAGMTPESLDLQIAVSRVLDDTMENKQMLITRARTALTGEMQHLMLFLLGEENDPVPPITAEGAWIAAALAKPGKKMPPILIKGDYHQQLIDRYQGNYKWETLEQEVTFKRYDWQKKKNVETTSIARKLKIDLHATAVMEKKDEGFLQKTIGKLFSTAKGKVQSMSWPKTFYDNLRIKGYYDFNENNNLRRVMLLSPHNPEPLLAQVIYHCLGEADFVAAEDKKTVTATIQTLYEIWKDEGGMSYLFLGTCMLAGDKTINGIAAELWLRETARNRIDNEKLGKIIATHEKVEWAPLKRLTDVMTKQLFQVSAYHNRQLQQLIFHILANLGDRPIKNLKKLKEIHAELEKLNAP